jgi:heme-degrading monooxygenase HmoA
MLNKNGGEHPLREKKEDGSRKEEAMIARIWQGTTPEEKSDAYFAYIMETGYKMYRSVEGNCGVYLLRRVREGKAQFLLISIWDSYDAIKKFAGPDIEKAVYFPEDKDFLLDMESHVLHYEVLTAPEDPSRLAE